MTPPVLELLRVTKTYDGQLTVLRDIDLTVARGELVAVVGPSGSGKSTLLHIMGTLDRASSGTTRVAGHDVGALSDGALAGLRASEIGFVFQQFFLLEGMTARENVADGLLYSGTPRAERLARADRVLARVGLADRAHQRAAKLSGGERQRVAIARAFVGRPSILFADEPTGNLDSRAGEAIVQILRELNSEGATVVVITHDRHLAEDLPRRIELCDGCVVGDSGYQA